MGKRKDSRKSPPREEELSRGERARAQIIVSGWVQGVGYRAFTCWAARSLHVDGYVMNLPDGKVQVEVEGEKEDILKYIGQLKKGPPMAEVETVDVKWLSPTGKFEGFHIRYSSQIY